MTDSGNSNVEPVGCATHSYTYHIRSSYINTFFLVAKICNSCTGSFTVKYEICRCRVSLVVWNSLQLRNKRRHLCIRHQGAEGITKKHYSTSA
jgi:hypothetical protein